MTKYIILAYMLGLLTSLLFLDWINPPKNYTYNLNVAKGIVVNHNGHEGRTVEFDLVDYEVTVE